MTGDEIMRTQYFRKVAQNFLQDQGKIRQLAVPIDLESPSKNESKISSSSGNEDTWKTINSMGNCTGLQNTGEMTTKQRLAQKKI